MDARTAAFDAGVVLSDGLDPAIVADSETLNLGGSEIIRPLKLNCDSLKQQLYSRGVSVNAQSNAAAGLF